MKERETHKVLEHIRKIDTQKKQETYSMERQEKDNSHAYKYRTIETHTHTKKAEIHNTLEHIKIDTQKKQGK